MSVECFVAGYWPTPAVRQEQTRTHNRKCGSQPAHQSLITDVLQFRLHPCAINIMNSRSPPRSGSAGYSTCQTLTADIRAFARDPHLMHDDGDAARERNNRPCCPGSLCDLHRPRFEGAPFLRHQHRRGRSLDQQIAHAPVAGIGDMPRPADLSRSTDPRRWPQLDVPEPVSIS